MGGKIEGKPGLAFGGMSAPSTAGKRKRAANAKPAGGGGGGWQKLNVEMTERIRKRQAEAAKRQASSDIPAGLAFGAMHMSDGAERTLNGTSIFDPVLCELNYRWFCPPGGTILDPFSGGSVRGLVAARLGRRYVGVDLRPEQIAANKAQVPKILREGDPVPDWRVGDSSNIDQICQGVEADFVFSCPPYADLEVYSDNPLDLSTMDYPAFREAYRTIIAKACALLKPDRFAAFVVGEVRDKHGHYYGFVPDTIAAFRDAGLAFYNEAILVTAAGSLPIRAGKQFDTTRKLGKTHQNLLIFVKGSAKAATAAIGPVEFKAIEEALAEEAEGEAEITAGLASQFGEVL